MWGQLYYVRLIFKTVCVYTLLWRIVYERIPLTKNYRLIHFMFYIFLYLFYIHVYFTLMYAGAGMCSRVHRFYNLVVIGLWWLWNLILKHIYIKNVFPFIRAVSCAFGFKVINKNVMEKLLLLFYFYYCMEKAFGFFTVILFSTAQNNKKHLL